MNEPAPAVPTFPKPGAPGLASVLWTLTRVEEAFPVNSNVV
jgi:hypothetical protein